MNNLHPKDVFNRRFGVVIACVAVMSWIGVLVQSKMTGDAEATTMTFITPLMLLWAMFLGLTRYGKGLGEVWENRRRWLFAGFGAVAAMELVSVLVRLS